MRHIDKIVVHCAATTPKMDIGVKEIRRWHVAKGWFDVGYHWIIRRDGTLEKGRDTEVVGAHVKGHNSYSVGICLVGGVARRKGSDGKFHNVAENNFTPEQWGVLDCLLGCLQDKYRSAEVLGHRDLDSNKECPSFDVRDWLDNGGGIEHVTAYSFDQLKKYPELT